MKGDKARLAVLVSGGGTNLQALIDAQNNGVIHSGSIEILIENKIDYIVLAGFMCILSESFTRSYPERIINVHPSLIPSFCGKGFYGLRVHEAALEYGVKVTGATVHFVNEIPDGGRIILPQAVESVCAEFIESGDK